MANYIDKNVYVGDTGKQLKDIKTNADNIPTNQEIINLIYPVGSVYLTLNKVNPSTFLGGTWEQVHGGYLYLAQITLEKTSFTGWNAQGHTLTTQEMPAHAHSIMNANSGGSASGYNYCPNVGSSNKGYYNMGTASNGGGQAHTHPIATVDLFCYKRTA